MAKDSLLHERLETYSHKSISQLLKNFSLPVGGLSTATAQAMREKYGNNEIQKRKDSLPQCLRRAFLNPLTVILLTVGFVSFFADTMLSQKAAPNSLTTAPIILLMFLISGCLRFSQELRSRRAADKLTQMIHANVSVFRDGHLTELPMSELVIGDRIRLSAGDSIPADVRFISASDLFVSQAAITGESAILEKDASTLPEHTGASLAVLRNLGFTGSTIISGSGEGIVLAVGQDTLYGSFHACQSSKKNLFTLTSSSIAKVLLKFMLLLVPMIFLLLGIMHGSWVTSFLFALSVAVGLTPEMLPMVITACLTKGAIAMSKKETLIKDMNSMQVFGSMDVLCMDKTGTLTNDKILLEYYMDALGNEDSTVLDMAFINSSFHSGAQNNIDSAVLKCRRMPHHEQHFSSLLGNWKKADELPFDYSRKCVSVLAHSTDGSCLMITKGSVDAVSERCSFVRVNGKTVPMGKDRTDSIRAITEEILEDGIKVIAVAIKEIAPQRTTVTAADENSMTLLGYLAFFDAPKASAKIALEKLHRLSVQTKILSGDSAEVTASVCERLNIPASRIVTGRQIAEMTDNQLREAAENCSLFAELTPQQKVKILYALRAQGHTVGFLGDGINDIPALAEADVGISVENAVDAAKEVSDVVLLKKDLNVLEKGILEGRKTFLNISKYVHISASSNLGNIIAIVCASLFLPFLPMTSLQLILLNLLYDMICMVLPWDNVDSSLFKQPAEFSGKHLSRFMLCFGPVSSVFDILTFLFLYFFVCPTACGGHLFYEITNPALRAQFATLFQSGWFLESIWSQILILYMLRTKDIPFVQSRPSVPVLLTTLAGILSLTVFSCLPAAAGIGLTAVPPYFYLYIIVVCVCYMLVASVVKALYLKKHSRLF